MEKTFVLLKPDALLRGKVGNIINRFEDKGLKLVGIKMIQLDDAMLDIHYSHLKDKPFFPRIKQFMKSTPVVLTCWEGLDVVETVRSMCGPTNGRAAAVGTVRGDYSMSMQTNLVHASDSPASSKVELERFFKENEIFDYESPMINYHYSEDEIDR